MNDLTQPGVTQDTLTQLHEKLASKSLDRVRDLLSEMHPSEVADFLESLPGKSRETIWNLLELDKEGDVLAHLQDAVRSELLEQMHPHEVAAATRDLETDDVADIIQDLPENVQDSVLLSMDEQNRLRLASVLSYPEDTAGGLMNTDVIPIRADVTLDVVVRYLRRVENIPEKTDNLMVVDRENLYLGTLSMIDILIRDPEEFVGDIMKGETGISADLSDKEVAKIFEQRDWISAAVIDEQGVLLGRITVDDVVDVIQEDAEQTVRSMAGLGDDDMFAPIFTSTRRRAVWLGINLATAFLGAWVIGRFEDTIQQLVALAVLMPIVAGMGGVAGSQTLTIAIRGIALGQLGKSNARALMLKETAVGLLNGLMWACVVSVIVIFWFGNVSLGFIIALAMIVNLLVAALAGAVIPLGLKRYGIDPAIAGSVLLTTVTDVVGFMTFLGLASIFLVS
ncbi:MAG: magnesium transporter [Gammaproteobacteria bacterium]|nr:MAG: magnesium transporter [Gammaproteobacteria bacterium]